MPLKVISILPHTDKCRMDKRYMIRVMEEKTTDVLIIGSGLAGNQALRSSIQHDLDITMVTSSTLCSGSSFYPGSWGLGLIAPKDKEDEQSLLANILHVGCGMCDRELSELLVKNIEERCRELSVEGMQFREPDDCQDKTLIPCFDTDYRRWRGLLYEDMKQTFIKSTQRSSIHTYEKYDLVELCVKDKRVYGAIFLNERQDYVMIRSIAVILATGGYAYLYKYHIPLQDIAGIGHSAAYKAGVKLKNLEFMQFIPAYRKPIKNIIYNERCFAYASIWKGRENILKAYGYDEHAIEKLMCERAKHGPFTARLEDKIIDIALFEAYLHQEETSIFYPDSLRKEYRGQMIEDYFIWLKKKGIQQHDSVSILPYFHASNGGIEIDCKAQTNILGLFACGECTTGMHGADRLGGTSTANALVYGKIAGEEACRFAGEHEVLPYDCSTVHVMDIIYHKGIPASDYPKIIEKIQEVMYTHACIEREEQGLQQGLDTIQWLKKTFVNSQHKHQRKLMHRTMHMLILSELLIKSMLERKESRGSHYRKDFPKTCHEFDKQIFVYKEDS